MYGTYKNKGTTDTTRNFSPAIWGNCPVNLIRDGVLRGYVDGDDFLPPGVISEDAVDDLYQKYIDTSNTIRLAANSTTAYGGILELVTDATDNDAPVIQRHGANAGSTAIGPYIIGNSAGAAFRLWFEARINKSSIADNVCAFACGLAQVGRAADNGLLEDDTGDIVDSISFIGWRNLNDNGEELDFVYQDGGQTAPVEVMANAATLVADTYIKLGFVFDPFATASQQIKLFINNVEQSTYVTTTNIDATTFPENDALAFVFGTKNGTAGASTGRIDWWRCVQLFEQNY